MSALADRGDSSLERLKGIFFGSDGFVRGKLALGFGDLGFEGGSGCGTSSGCVGLYLYR